MVDKQINIVYDFLDELGGIERVIVFQANTLKTDTNLKPKIFFSHIAKGKEELLNTELGLKTGISILQPTDGLNKIINFTKHMLFPDRFYKLPGPIISHSFLSSRMALTRKNRGEGNYIAIVQHPPNFLYDRTWAWVNNFPRFVAYVGGLVLSPLLRKWDKEAMMGADTLYVNSEYTKKRIEKIYDHKNIKIMYPPIGVQFIVSEGDKKKAQKMILEDRGINKNFILMHGRQIKDKNPQWVLQSFAKMKYQNVDLVISGTIENKKELDEWVDDLKIKDRTHILGRVSEEELLALYNHAKCFVIAAPREDFGLTTVEAIACGTPAVAWGDGAGPSEVIINNVNGLLADPYKEQDMADKMDEVCKWNKNRDEVSSSVDKFKAKKIKEEFLDAVKEAALDYEYKYHA